MKGRIRDTARTARAELAFLSLRPRLPRSYMHARTPARTASDVAGIAGPCTWTAVMVAIGLGEACAGRRSFWLVNQERKK